MKKTINDPIDGAVLDRWITTDPDDREEEGEDMLGMGPDDDEEHGGRF